MSYPHRKGQGSPKLMLHNGPTHVAPEVIARLDVLVRHMTRDPYVMGRPSVAGAARAALMLGVAELERRYGIATAEAAE